MPDVLAEGIDKIKFFDKNGSQLFDDPMAESEKRSTLRGDTTFVFMAAALVFIMTPGLGYFYSGMARSKTALSLIMLCFLTMAVVLLQWLAFGASLAFSEHGNAFIGDFHYAGGRHVGSRELSPSVASITFFMYQGMFAAITPALIFGSVAERVKLVPCIVFVFIWTTVVYDPVAYWTWGEKGFLLKMGSLDFAGGTPVHICSGFAGLAMTLVIGKRTDFEHKEFKAHNISNVFLGTALLSFGWFGFNGGSALAGTSRASMASMVSLLSSAASGLTWVFFEYRHHQKLSGLDFCCGAIAGLAAITPGSGFLPPWAAVVVGFSNGILCNLGCKFKTVLGIDDALDTFGVHGIGGFYGNIVAGIFAQKWIAELDDMKIDGGWIEGNWMQVPYQLAGSFAGAGWSFFWTYLLVFVMQKIPFLRLRLTAEEELVGDLAEMGEGAPHQYPAPLIYDDIRKFSSTVFEVNDGVGAQQQPPRLSSASLSENFANGDAKKENYNTNSLNEQFGKAMRSFFHLDSTPTINNAVTPFERVPNIPEI